MKRFQSVAVGCSVGVLSALGPLPVATAGAPAAGDGLTWRECRGGAECAELAVPLDDTVLGSPTIELALIRYRARRPTERIGALLVNPGGPGGSGVDFAASAAGLFPREVRDRFDIVGFDPRGVARSSGVDCTDDLDSYFALDFTPYTDAQLAALERGVQQLVGACTRSEGALLPYLSTPRAARDIDRIRAALGEDTLTYVGFSYGTYLGAWYAEQFPERVRALVLDGALDPALDALAFQVQQAKGFEQSLERFLESCSRDRSCAFRRGGRTARAYDRLRARVDRRPLPANEVGEGRTLNGTQFDAAVTQLLYEGRRAWPILADALDGADDGDGAELLFEFDAFVGRDDDGTYDDTLESFLAISCADSPPVGDLAAFRTIVAQAEAVAPRLGVWIVNNSLACALWPVRPALPRALHARGAAPVLVIGTTNDPATPLVWAQGLAGELESGVLLTVKGSRHTSFAAGNPCVDALVTRYLVDLEAPDPGTRC